MFYIDDPRSYNLDKLYNLITFSPHLSSFDCPNLSWEFIQDDLNGNYCIPVGVSVTCDSRSVIVTFNVDHIYKGLNSDRIDTAEATAIVGK